MDIVDASTIDDLGPGTIVSGRYRIEKQLGAGQMGVVYLVHDAMLDQNCAMKVLHSALGKKQSFRERFLREVKLMHQVNHENVVRTFDVGQDVGHTYFTMEYLPGRGLDLVLAKEGPLPIPRVLKLAEQLALGLEAIHARDIIHRDLKPANILVLPEDIIKITDFGVARPKISALTQHGGVFGTMLYMAPEIVLGRPVTPAVDAYSLGIIIYEMLVGQPPFAAEESTAILRMQVEKRPVPPHDQRAEVPIWLNQLVLRLLEKRVDRRIRPKVLAECIAARRGEWRDAPKDIEPVPSDPVFEVKGRYVRTRKSAASRQRKQMRMAVVMSILLMWVMLGIFGAFTMGVTDFFAWLSRLLGALGV